MGAKHGFLIATFFSDRLSQVCHMYFIYLSLFEFVLKATVRIGNYGSPGYECGYK